MTAKEKLKSIRQDLDMQTDKLLIMIMNAYRENPKFHNLGSKILLSLKEYGKLCGYAIDPVITEKMDKYEIYTAKQIGQTYLQHLKKSLNYSLLKLQNLDLIEEERFKKYKAEVTLRPKFIEILSDSKIPRYPNALFEIHLHHPHAYTIAKYIFEENPPTVMKLKNLLEIVGLPSRSEYKKQVGIEKSDWCSKTKYPLQRALNCLVNVGILSDWSFNEDEEVVMVKGVKHYVYES